MAWLKAHVGKYDATVTDISDETYMLAFQGPKAPEILTRLADADLVKPPRFTAVQTKLLGRRASIVRAHRLHRRRWL